MKLRYFLVCLLPLLAGAAHAQDVEKVVSPDGQLEFRLFTTLPAGAQLNSLAYQLWYRGKLLLDTSCMGLDIHFQEPILGENLGLSSAKTSQGTGYNGLFADYLQNSTTGRRIDLEARVYNDGVAFRYVLPKQFALLDLLIEEEMTEFHFANPAERPSQAPLPYSERAPSGLWLGIFESRLPGFPVMSLVRNEPNLMISHLPDRPNDPAVAFVGTTPWTGPWRIVAIAPEREQLTTTSAVQGLKR